MKGTPASHPLDAAKKPIVKPIDMLFDECGRTFDEIAALAKLPPDRLEAIVVGRWTPSPEDRRRIAEAFGVSPDDVVWGHTMDPRNVRYHRFGLKEKL